jgi:glycosyltransferase involved in cell wall biosynthesis
MKASVIITTYKQSVILKYILLALLSQKTQYDFEIIVCDDGGVDNSFSVIDKIRDNEKKIKIHYLWQQDRSFRAASARNMGISRAKGDIIMLLDGDMIPKTDYVQSHIEHHLKNPKSLLTGGRLNVDDSDFLAIIEKADSFSEILKLISEKSFLNTEELRYRKSWYHGSKPWMSVFSCNLSFPRSEIAKYSELFVGCKV